MTAYEIRKRLKFLKNNLDNFSDLELYHKLSNVANECDLTHIIYNSDLRTSDEIDDMIVNNIHDYDVDRLRCFIGDTYSASVYKLDGYNNLDNVSCSDFEEIIDEILYELED